MKRFGHWGDAFRELRKIAEESSKAEELKTWARAAALLAGELANFEEAWGDYRPYYTVDVPYRTIEFREITNHSCSSYGQPVLVDRFGQVYNRWMVRPL
ncbi:MAG: hypothetical protein SVR04_07245 [Spirochaetota bacterium]|nr:hypothetical protein [Spirochaetota bacterium]